MVVDSLADVVRRKRVSRLQRYLFNGSAPAISFWSGAQVFFLLSGAGPLFGAAGRTPTVLLLPLCRLGHRLLRAQFGTDRDRRGARERPTRPSPSGGRTSACVYLNYFAAASAAFFSASSFYARPQPAGAGRGDAAARRDSPGDAIVDRPHRGRREHVATVDRLYLSTIGALSTAIEAKDGVTSMHIHRVQHYAMGLANALGSLDELTMKALQAAALLHDTGKLAVPERILNKPGKLTPVEFEAMKLHVDVGADILSSIDFPYPVVPIVRAHHENWDGSGYPNGLKGLEIPIGARILSVVDCYDALTSDRPYRAGMTDDEALTIIRARRGTFYDPAVVDMFERVCRDIAPLAVKPQLQKAIDKISKTVAMSLPQPVAAAAPISGERRPGCVARAREPGARGQRPPNRGGHFVVDLVARASRRAECQLRVLRERAGERHRQGGVRGGQRRVDAAGARDEAGREADRLGRREPAADRELAGDPGPRIRSGAGRPQLLPGVPARRRRPAGRSAVAIWRRTRSVRSRRRRCNS